MPDTTPDEDDVFIRPFADFLREQDAGRTHDELSEVLHGLLEAVKDTGKVGTLTLTFKVSPMKKSGNGALLISAAVAKKLPAHDRRESIYFVDAQGNPTRNDPAQLTFDSLREVGGGQAPTTELKETKRA